MIDASIPLQVRGPQLENPLTAATQAANLGDLLARRPLISQAIQAGQLENRQREMQLTAAQKQIDDQALLQQAIAAGLQPDQEQQPGAPQAPANAAPVPPAAGQPSRPPTSDEEESGDYPAGVQAPSSPATGAGTRKTLGDLMTPAATAGLQAQGAIQGDDGENTTAPPPRRAPAPTNRGFPKRVYSSVLCYK